MNGVLEEIEQVRTGVVVIGGDMISGPMPRQTLDRLGQLGNRVYSLRGNADREAVAAFDDQPFTPRMPEEVREVTRWTAQQLERSQRDFLAQLPEQITLHVEGLGAVLFCHAPPRTAE